MGGQDPQGAKQTLHSKELRSDMQMKLENGSSKNKSGLQLNTNVGKFACSPSEEQPPEHDTVTGYYKIV